MSEQKVSLMFDWFEEHIKKLHTHYKTIIDDNEKHYDELRKKLLKYEVPERVQELKYESSFDRFMNEATVKDDSSEITVTKLYKVYSCWYDRLSDPVVSKLKIDAFKSLLEDKFNCVITKVIKGIDFKEES